MDRHCSSRAGRIRRRLQYLVTAKGTDRSVIDAIQSRITKQQGKLDLPAWRLTVFERGGDLHANMIFVDTGEIAAHLRRSTFADRIKIKPVTDAPGLVRYLSKERTPQAGFRRSHLLGGRVSGSHPLPGGGDRVCASRELERDLLEGGHAAPWDRTNARRSTGRKPYRPRQLTARAPRPAGQLVLLPEVDRPVARLRHFGGGYIPASVAREIEFRRGQRGLSQRELGKLIGRSQGQLANAIRGHDPISATAVNRLRDALLSPLK
jgi:hypothetical protein